MKKDFCQSCGMPLNMDPNHGGTNKDKSKSFIYCSLCYQNGKFLNPKIDTAKKMQNFCIEKMHEQGTPKFLAWLFTRNIPRLQRWKNNQSNKQ